MKVYVDDRDIEEIKSVVRGEKELCSTSVWGEPGCIHEREVTIKVSKYKKKYKKSWFRRFRKASRLFWRTLRED